MAFTLRHGIHRGTLTSRDTGNPQTFETREAALQSFADQKAWYRSIGYVIWFADIVHPDGKVEYLEGDSNYR